MIRQKQLELKAKCFSKVQGPDRITTLSQAIIETILCLLETEEAARTSVLSREWRYKWTTIPKLEFVQPEKKQPSASGSTADLETARKNMDTRCQLFYAIYQVLLLRQGPILDFFLWTDAHHTCFEIDQIILHLSRNHPVKKLTFQFDGYNTYSLPLSFFSMHHLTDLSLENCDIKHVPIFNGFGSLTSLSLMWVKISGNGLVHLLSNCPSLKSLYLHLYDYEFLGDEKPSIMELFKCLPMIEDLDIWGYIFPELVQASVPQELPTSLIHLKYCSIDEMSFNDGSGLPFLGALFKCSPNLEKIEIDCNERDLFLLVEYPITLEEYSDVWLEHLSVLEIDDFTNVKLVLEFVKFILVRSPNLKRVRLRSSWAIMNECVEMLETLLRAPRVSTVEIVIG